MSSSDLNKILAELVRNNANYAPLPSTQSVVGLSNAILSSVPVQKPYNSGQVTHGDVRGPSLVNRILDLMSRPLYGTLNAVKGNIEANAGKSFPEQLLGAARMLSPITNPQELGDIWQGVSGKEKTTGKDVLDTAGFSPHMNNIEKAAASFGLDVLADPTTYIGGLGLVGKLGKGARLSTEALHAVEEGAGKGAQDLAKTVAEQASKHAEDLKVRVPKPGEPAPAIGSPPRLFQAGPGPIGLAEQKAAQEGSLLKDVGEPTLQLDLKQSVPMKALPVAEKSAATKAMEELKALNKQIQITKSPVTKNILKKQAEKISAGVEPADVLSRARVSPEEFPTVSIGQRWIDTAKSVAERFLKDNRLPNINHIGQSNLYDRLLHAASKVRKDRRAFHVLQMLRVAEDTILSQGRHLVDGEGISVRLSDVANMMGGPRALTPRMVADFRKARPSQAIEDLKSFTTPQVVSETLDPVVKTGADIATTISELPPSQTVELGSQISKELGKIAEKAGASSREAGTAKDFINELFNPRRDQLYSTVEQEARNLVRQSATGKVNPESLHKVSTEVYKALGANPKVLGREIPQSKVVEGIMTRFATWWNAKDLKPFSREYIDSARNVAAAFAETMKPIVAKTTATERKVAFSVAQGKLTAGSPKEQALADQFKWIVQRLLGTHGITDNAESVLMRSGTVQNELNKELPKELQLIGTKGKDELGREFDYTNGNWMHSWEQWKINEPAEALYQLTRSLQLVTRKNSMWDDAIARWGMPVKTAEFQHEAQGIARLKGTYFPQEIATQLTNLQKQLERDIFKVPHPIIGLFDKVQRMWKTGVTIYSPSHHIRNLNGDIYLAALDGVTSPKSYATASKILHAFPTRYKSLEDVFNIMDPGLRESALRARPGNIVLTTKRGDKLTAEQVYQAAESHGLFPRAMNIEDLVGEGSPALGTFGSKFKPFKGKVYDAATRVSELREHWVRLAHFTDVLSKSNQPLRVAIETAAKRVKKFHPDGTDLTGFEQNVLRRIIPFYSWMRKATPLVIEGAVMRPHITLAFPKLMADMQIATGIDSQGPGDPFPMDQMFPDWIKEKGIGPLLGPGSGLGREANWRGAAPGDTIINPSNPFLDQLQQIAQPKQTLLSGLTPVARIPIELLTGQTSLGIPIQNQEGGTPGYLAQQVPAVGIGARVTGLTRSNEPYNPEQLINWLTGLGVTGTGPYQQQSQIEIRNALNEAAKKQRGNYK